MKFTTPVEATIPLSGPLGGGSDVKLFYFDTGDPSNPSYPADYSGWKQTDFVGTVSPDGRSVVAIMD